MPTRHTETHKALIEEVNPDEHQNKTQAAAIAAIKKSIHDHIVNLYKEEVWKLFSSQNRVFVSVLNDCGIGTFGSLDERA